MQDLEGELNPEVGRLDYLRRRPNELRRLEINTNIFPSEWDLWTDLRTTTRQKRLYLVGKASFDLVGQSP
jgi:hypothetical protein